MKPILTTTASLLKIPQLDLAYNKKKLAEWHDKKRLIAEVYCLECNSDMVCLHTKHYIDGTIRDVYYCDVCDQHEVREVQQ